MLASKSSFASIGRAAALATIAAVALTAFQPSMALAGSAGHGLSTSAGISNATDFSARRYYRGGRHYGGGGAAAAMAFAGIVGTGIAIAASQPRYYDSYGYYGGGPVYGGPVYYGGPAYYGYGPGYGYYGRSYRPGGYDNPNYGW